MITFVFFFTKKKNKSKINVKHCQKAKSIICGASINLFPEKLTVNRTGVFAMPRSKQFITKNQYYLY